ncbi:MAG: helix-turn-helix domain-containing protein [Candidatus Margulisbacteria bacterium]|jgi:DNA-binding XRE family transcriptional regulator|nr:helix-turn-helix domain-containing protein [Candidatus Margulisiibacteriota bacterium]
MNELKLLGKTIERIRIAKKIPRERFSWETETARSFIYQIERGQGNPSIKTLIKMARVLDCKVQDFIRF